ncbi:MAG: efflux RND transporter periplasmic adaptor subunit [Aquincola sp.]|nr:efflux RND transporter periplasmic adaptor subunit [Aquincola sp.]MDH5330755.1 efflux RND transporter periplasmic adaptor subunit [Aquincola sp.]
MAIKKFHTWVALGGIATVGIAAWWYQQRDTDVGRKEMAGASPAAPGAPSAAAARGAGGGGPATVEVGKVEVLRIEDDAQAVGSLRAAQTVMLRPEVSGRIVRIGFADGARVRRGQLLVQLDATLQSAQLKQAEAQAAIARTNLQRSRELQAQNFVSQSAVDQNAAALEVAEAQVSLAQAQLSRLSIVAPFDGVAGIKSVALGDYLKDGADIVSLEDRSRMWVDFRLPERFVGRTRVGQTVQVTLDALPGKQFDGKVEALDSLVDSNGRSLLVRARVDRPGPELKSGMFARTRIVFTVRERALMVPEEALVPQGGKQFLIKAVPGPPPAAPVPLEANGEARPGLVSQRIEAKLGVRMAGKVEVLEGLAPGDLVVTAGQNRVMRGDGLPLRVIDLDKPAGGPGGKPGARPPGAASAPRTGAPA